jgi:hypothetical protein
MSIMVKLQYTSIPSTKKPTVKDHIIQEVTAIGLHLNSMNTEDDFCPKNSKKPFITS